MINRTIDISLDAGADIFYHEFEGTHDLDYFEDEMPRIIDFLNRHPREPFPPELVWETADTDFGECRWLKIDEISLSDKESWHEDYNVAMVDSTITIGFIPDDSHDGDGVKAGNILAIDCLARRIGLLKGDIIVNADNTKIANLDDLSEFKAGLKHGDLIALRVIRDGEEKTLTGTLPQPRKYNLFHRAKPSAKVIARYAANRIDLESSRLGAFSLLIHPDMIRLNQKLVVTVDGDVVYEDKVLPSIPFMLKNFLANRDRNLIYVAKVEIGL
jgi:hypothetical protein